MHYACPTQLNSHFDIFIIIIIRLMVGVGGKGKRQLSSGLIFVKNHLLLLPTKSSVSRLRLNLAWNILGVKVYILSWNMSSYYLANLTCIWQIQKYLHEVFISEISFSFCMEEIVKIIMLKVYLTIIYTYINMYNKSKAIK